MSGSAGDEVEEAAHRHLAVEHALVHAHVQDVGPALHLLPRHLDGGVVVTVEHQAAELARPGDVGALADQDEVRLRRDGERLEPGQAGVALGRRRLARGQAVDRVGDGGDVLGAGAAAAAHDVEPALARELAEQRGHVVRRVVVAAELVGQAGVRVAGGRQRGDARQLLDVGPHVVGAERAVDAYREQVVVRDRVVERLQGLAREGAAAPVRDGDRGDDRHAAGALVEQARDAPQRRLHVERVDVGLGDEQVDAPLDQRGRLLIERLGQLIEGDRARARVVDVGRQRRGLGGRAQRAGHPARAARRILRDEVVDRLARDHRRGQVDGADLAGQSVVLERDRRAGEAVCLDDVGAGGQKAAVDVADDVRPGDREHVAAAAQRAVVVAVLGAAVVLLGQAPVLDHRAHGPVQDQDAAGERLPQCGGRVHGHVCTIERRPPSCSDGAK